MKQAVPLLHPERPLIATGMEETVARLSDRAVLARRAGTVTEVSAERIVVSCEDGREDPYELQDYSPTSSATCFLQRPVVEPGQKVLAGQILAEAAAMQQGQLALGVNPLFTHQLSSVLQMDISPLSSLRTSGFLGRVRSCAGRTMTACSPRMHTP